MHASKCPKCSSEIPFTRVLDGPLDIDLPTHVRRFSCPTCLSVVRFSLEPSSNPLMSNETVVDLSGDHVQQYLQHIKASPDIQNFSRLRPSFRDSLPWILRTPEVFLEIQKVLNLGTQVHFAESGFIWLQSVTRSQLRDWEEFIGWSVASPAEVHRLNPGWARHVDAFLAMQFPPRSIEINNEENGLPRQIAIVRKGTTSTISGWKGQRVMLNAPPGHPHLLAWDQTQLLSGLDMIEFTLA